MATAQDRARELNRLIAQSAERFEGYTERQAASAMREIEKTKRTLTDRLITHVDEDSVIRRDRMRIMLNDLDRIQREIAEEFHRTANDSIQKAADYHGRDTAGAFGSVDIPTVGIDFDRVNAQAVRYVTQRFGEDGLVLSDRVWQFAAGQREELENVIRQGIIQGKALSEMRKDVEGVYANSRYAVDRLIRTEMQTAYRVSTSYTAQQSKAVQYLRIHRGEADRPEHMCTILSKEDRYGQGEGVFLPTDSEIYNPHPNCTSWLEYVVDDSVIDDMINDREFMMGGADVTPEELAEGNASLDALGELDGLTSKKDMERWARDNIGIGEVDFSDFNEDYAKEMSRQLYKLKQRYPEAVENNLRVVASGQRWYRETYEERLMDVTYYNMRRNNVAETPANIEEWKNRVKRAKRKGKLIVPNRMGTRTNALASRGLKYHNGIYINKNRADLSLMERQRKYTKEAQWHSTSAPIGTVTHEFGHIVDYWLDSIDPSARDRLVKDRYEKYAKKGAKWYKENLSEYGLTNDREFFAEAFAEYIHEGDNAREIAKEFGKALDDLIESKRRGGGN